MFRKREDKYFLAWYPAFSPPNTQAEPPKHQICVFTSKTQKNIEKTALAIYSSQPEIKPLQREGSFISIISLISRLYGIQGCAAIFSRTHAVRMAQVSNLPGFRKGNNFYISSFLGKEGGFTHILIAVTTWQSKTTSDYVKKINLILQMSDCSNFLAVHAAIITYTFIVNLCLL